MENDGTYRWAPNDPGKDKKMPPLKKLGTTILLVLLVVAILKKKRK